MNDSDVTNALLLALARSARAFADSIEAGIVPAPLEDSRKVTAGGPVTFDPRTEPPPRTANPSGTLEEQKMAYLTYLGAVRLINKTEDRGANRDEVRKYAMKAGYENGRAVNGFSNGVKNTESRADGRWVTIPDGLDWLEDLQKDLDVDLPDVGAEPD